MYITSSNLNNLVQVIKDTELESYQVKIESPIDNSPDSMELELKNEKEDYITGLLEYCNKFTDF